MSVEKKPVILKWDNDWGDINPEAFDSGEASFEALLDITCERLWEKHAEYSIRRIREMDEELIKLEKEVDEFADTKAPGVKV